MVKLTIGGTLENPRLALSSNSQPPIPQSDLLSYVAFGRSGGTLLQVGGGSSLGGAATNGGIAGSAIMGAAGSTLTGMAVGVLADEIEGEATRSMGIDQFSINPDPELYTQLASRNVNGVLQGTTIEAGKYVNPRTFVAVQSRLDPTNSPPGLRLQARAKKGFQFEATLEPRLPLRKPTLEDQGGRTAIRGFSVFGAYLIREWRF